jgi:hypothetical protein
MCLIVDFGISGERPKNNLFFYILYGCHILYSIAGSFHAIV